MSVKKITEVAKMLPTDIIVEAVKGLIAFVRERITKDIGPITLNSYIKKQKNYNESSTEGHGNETVINGNSDGLVNITKPAMSWEEPLWKRMMANTWFETEPDLSKEASAYKKLSKDQQRMYDLTVGSLIANDSFQTRNLAVNMAPYVSDPNLLQLIVRQDFEEALHCYTDGTEVLTDKGFVCFSKITLDSNIANYHENGTIDFTLPSEVMHSPYDGIVYHFSGQRFDLEVTPNHRMVRKNTRLGDKFEVKLAEEISFHNHKIPVSGYSANSEDRPFTSFDKFRIAYQADGSICNNGNKTKDGVMYLFKLKKTRKVKRLKKIVDDCCFRNTISTNKDGYTLIYVWSDYIVDKDFSWVELPSITVDWGLSFLDELTYWDGSRSGGLLRYSNTNKEAVDKVVSVAAMSGIRCGSNVVMTTGFEGQDLGDKSKMYWTLNFVDSDYVSGRAITKTKKQYVGSIHCVTVPSSYLVVRRNGKVSISGNSRSYGVLSTDVFKGDDPQRVFNIHKTDPELAKRNRWLQSLYDPLDIADGEPVTFKMFLQAVIANLILEGIMFQGGFISVWSLGATMIGSAKMIAFIARDERTHLAIFFGVFNGLLKQFPTLDTAETKKMFLDMLSEAVEIEIEWLKYTTGDGVFIFSDDNIREFIQGKANEVSSGIGYGNMYDSKVSVLKKLEDTYGKINDTRSNFFESKPAGYSKGTVDMSDI